MAKNQSTYTLKIDAELGNLQKILNEAKNSLSGFLASGSAPKGLEKAFEKINALLGQISDKTGKPLDLKGLTGTGKDLAIVEENFRAIIRLLGEFDDLSDDIKLSFLSADEQKKIVAITNALKTYGAAAAESAKKVKQLESAQKILQRDESNLNKANKKVGGLQSKKTSKEAELVGARGKLTAVQGVEGVDPEKIAQYQAKVAKLEADLTNLNNELAKANKELTASQNAYEASAKSVKTLTNEVDRAGKESLHKLKEEAKNLGVSLEGLNGYNAAKQIEILTTRLEDFKAESLKGAKPAFQTIVNGCEQAEQAADKLGEEVKDASSSLQKMDEAAAQRDAFETKIKSFLGLQGAAQLMRAALRDAIQTITELDATMTEMAVVTDLSVGDYWDQLPEYSKQASELGVSINSAYKAATLYYQQGLKGNEVTKISAETLKMAKVAGLDAAEATDKMTAALRGFNMELNETSAQKVADVYSELAAITAADVDEISTAMTKTASIAHSAGMEFETTAAFLSQIIETTRESAETAGTAMKTVIARFQELKKSPSEIGEVDGEIVDANAIETALRSVGVALRDTSGQFRELDDVFLELSSKWDSLDKNTQRYIATIAAGSRQQSRFIAMMSDYGRTQELVASANNSAGASQKQFEKTTESLEYKIEKLKNAWHEFTMGIMNSDLVKFGVDVLGKFLEIINKATNGLDGLGGSVVKIIGIFSIFKMGMKVFNKFEAPIMKLFKKITEWAGIEGFKAGKAYTEAADAGSQEATKNKQQEKTEPKQEDVNINTEDNNKESVSSGGKLGEITGITQFKEGFSKKKKLQQEFDAQAQKKQRWEKATEDLDKVKENGQHSEEYAAAVKELEEAQSEYNAELDLTNEEQQEALKLAKAEGWENISQGLGKMSQTAMAAGMGISALGGVISSLGLEGLGDSLATIGNVITTIAAGVSALIPIVVLLSKVVKIESGKMIIAGKKTSLAWWQFALILLGIVAVITIIAAITNAINQNSAETKLEKATNAAKEAEEAASKAKQAYENLGAELEDLNSKYDVMDNLVRGTEEWNKALQETNSSVLGLIEKYPELAAMVENVDGYLKLDTNSSDVKAIMKQYEAKAIAARGVSLSAASEVSRKKQDVAFDKLDKDATVEYNDTSGGWSTFGKSVGYGAAGTAGAGALTGAAIGALGGPLGSLIGAGIGAVVGGIAGAVGGTVVGSVAGPIAEYMANENQELGVSNDEEAREKTDKIAEAMASGAAGTTKADLQKFLVEEMGIVSEASEDLAERLWENAAELKEYGATIVETNAAQKAYYSAMAQNAQQMINLEKYSTDDIEQMNNAIDADRMKKLEEEEKQRLAKEAEYSNSAEFEAEQKAFVQSQYGNDARIDGNKVIYYEDGLEKEKVFEDDEAWINAIAAANATKEAADAMEKVPDAIDKAATALGGKENASVVEKALTNANKLTQDELRIFKETVGANNKGEIDSENEVLKQLYKSNPEFKEIYGEYTDFIKAYEGIIKQQNDSWANIEKKANKLGFDVDNDGQSVISNMSAQAANTWTNLLADVMPTGTESGADEVNNALSALLAGKSQKDVDSIMSQIGAIDKMDAGAWDSLAYTLEDMGLVVDSSDQSLQTFIDEAKKVTGAIEKIDFSNFNQQINQTIELLKKAEEGARKYSEEEYNSFIAANKGLKKDFIQIGNEYVYLGTAMSDLTDAIMENTIAKLDEANFLLAAQAGMAGILESRESISTSADTEDQRKWLVDTVAALAAEGYDVKNLGIAGLGLNTQFSKLDAATISDMVSQVLSFRGQADTLEDLKDTSMRDSIVASYTLNDTAYNARMGYAGGEQAANYRDALRIQGIEAKVGDTMLQSYANASAQYEEMMKQYEGKTFEEAEAMMGQSDKAMLENFRLVSQNMVDMIYAVEENAKEKEQIEALAPLAEKVASAIEKQRQSTIDKLSDVNESIKSANDLLINKLQEQIDFNRQQQENQEMKDNLTSMYAQQAYLGMDTSGANALAMVDNKELIKQAEEDYRNTMVDQAIQQLQDANEQAAQQRERQINLLQQQLDYEMQTGQIADQAASIVRDSIKEVAAGQHVSQTQLNEYMQNSLESLGGMEKTQAKEEWMDLIYKAIHGTEGEQSSEPASELPQGGLQLSTSGDSGKSVLTDDTKNLQSEQTYINAMNAAISTLNTSSGGTSKNIGKALSAYNSVATSEGGTAIDESTLKSYLSESEGARVVNGSVDGVTVSGLNSYGAYAGQYDEVSAILDGHEYIFQIGHLENGGTSGKAKVADETVAGELNKIVGNSPKDGWIAMYNKIPYMYIAGDRKAWYSLSAYGNDDGQTFAEDYLKKIRAFKTGGLANFTGPAWLDGTTSKPEYVLNAEQTERFFSLVDVLEGLDTKEAASSTSGDNYFDISINVEKLNNDYDVEQIAEKIRRMIYNDASYRNVNAINHIR